MGQAAPRNSETVVDKDDSEGRESEDLIGEAGQGNVYSRLGSSIAVGSAGKSTSDGLEDE